MIDVDIAHALESWHGVNVTANLAGAAVAYRIRLEERQLLEVFGPACAANMRRTWRLIPGWCSRSTAMVEVAADMPHRERDGEPLESISFREVDKETWADFERLFDGPGAPKYCWCMVWRAVGPERENRDSKSRKSYIRQRVADGVPIGIIGYLDGQPIAWCSIAPKPTYRKLGGIDDPQEDPEKVWSLVCFYVPRRLRGQGISHRLLSAAVEHARRRGASVVEAYPVDPESPSYRFMGYVGSFQAAGFKEVGRAGTRRHVMRLKLEPLNTGRTE